MVTCIICRKEVCVFQQTADGKTFCKPCGKLWNKGDELVRQLQLQTGVQRGKTKDPPV